MNEPGGDDDAFTRDLRERLRASETPDAVVRARLSAARARAIDVRRARPAWTWTAAGVALAASLVIAVLTVRPTAEVDFAGEQDDVAQGQMFELLLDDDDQDPVLEAELYEDLDVLTWLAEDERA